jgi:pantothenate kinase type III
MIDDLLLKESQKEITFVSKELEEILETKTKNNINSDMYFNAVFKGKSIIIDYIKLVNGKNRVKIKGHCNCLAVKELLVREPVRIELIYKEAIISTFILKNKIYSFSAKKNNENSYIIMYKVKIGE